MIASKSSRISGRVNYENCNNFVKTIFLNNYNLHYNCSGGTPSLFLSL